jgi:hypothetical protein
MPLKNTRINGAGLLRDPGTAPQEEAIRRKALVLRHAA